MPSASERCPTYGPCQCLLARDHRKAVLCPQDQRRRGFSVTELLVVVAIIAILVAIIVPVASSARSAARRMREASAMRQVILAWTSYSVDNKGWLLPGFKTGLPVFQEDGTGIPPTAYGSVPEIQARYPWRLIRYLDHDFRALYVNQNEDMLQQLQSSDPSQFYYFTSLYPSFGLNSVWVGGDEQRYGFLPQTLPSGQLNPLYGFYANRLSSLKHTDRVTIFASAHTNLTADQSMVEGYFRIEAPYFLAGQPTTWAAEYDADTPPSWGNLSARNNGQVVVGVAGGGVDLVPVEEMRDMRRWADQATSATWQLNSP